jgi:RNA-directed DNA polymerase
VDRVSHPKYAVKAAHRGASWMQSASFVNGPSRRTDWNVVNWRRADRIVRNLRQRIFRATQANDLRRVRSLQKLMLRCYSNILLSVRRVTQVNAGKYTPGVDKLVVKTPAARGRLVDQLTTYQPWRAHPARRVYIPKTSDPSKLRPLGIPTVIDRCLQARIQNALEPEWEARFEGSSYGFRPGRSCQDAIVKVYQLARPNKRKKWVVDADIKGAFDTIDHDFLLRTLGDVPGRELVRQWLKAGVMQEGAFHDTPAGTPQGGVISPLLLNVALHGMEAALGVRQNNREEIIGRRAVVRYADDFVVFCESKEDAERVKDTILPPWLAERGLTLSAEKTRIVHLAEGFDFLGFNVRHYEAPQTTRSGYKLLIKPAKKAVVAKRKEIKEEWLRLRGSNAPAVIARLNPLIRGWANYYRPAVAFETFRSMDRWMLRRQRRFVKFTHPNKSWWWRKNRYWGKWNKQRQDQWVFGDKKSGRYLLKFVWFKIVRHTLVRGSASPDNPSQREYWWARRKVHTKRLAPSDRKLGASQGWVCRLCGMPLMNGEDLHRHHRQAKAMGGSDAYSNRELVHLYCHQQETHRQGYGSRRRVKNADEQL